ncbi:alpha/beta fold hydrolase [Bosea sp. RAF48]|uniref:alpha/beta fold hydrolase n=1 Tax=Bosea sp. RAF48 TaxID=3237480 RepID=UPI003F91A28B
MPDGSERDWEISTSHGQIFVRTWDEVGNRAAPIVLFDGQMDSAQSWGDFPWRLSRSTGHMVVAFDRLGPGRSGPFLEVPSADFWEREVQAATLLIGDHLGFRSFIACGHNLGGAIAVDTAARRGNACLGLITIGGWAHLNDGIRRGILQAGRPGPERDEAAAPAGLDPGGTAYGSLDAWASSPTFDVLIDEALSKLRCPVLAVHGELDEVCSLEHARRIAFGRGCVGVIPGAGASPHKEKEGDVLAAIRDFLALSVFPLPIH